MTDNSEISNRVEETASKYDIEIKSIRTFDNTLFVETDSYTNEMSYLAALWFYALSDYEFHKVTIRQNQTNEIQEFTVYEILGQLITAVDYSE